MESCDLFQIFISGYLDYTVVNRYNKIVAKNLFRSDTGNMKKAVIFVMAMGLSLSPLSMYAIDGKADAKDTSVECITVPKYTKDALEMDKPAGKGQSGQEAMEMPPIAATEPAQPVPAPTEEVLPTAGPAQVPSTSAPKATEKPKKKTVHTYRVKKVKGKKQVVNEKGKKVKKSFVTVKKKTYYCDKAGRVVYGWFQKGKQYYYASRSSGVIQKKKKVDGIRVKKDGKAVKSKRNVAKIKTMIYARKQVALITKASDSKSQKLKKCFDWVISFPYVQHRKLDDIYKKKGWEVTVAQDIFTRGGGCCVSDAAAFGFLAKECGYSKVYVGHDTSHGWTEIKGRVYDPLFAEAKDYNKYYNCTYKTYGLWCVGKRKL